MLCSSSSEAGGLIGSPIALLMEYKIVWQNLASYTIKKSATDLCDFEYENVEKSTTIRFF